MKCSFLIKVSTLFWCACIFLACSKTREEPEVKGEVPITFSLEIEPTTKVATDLQLKSVFEDGDEVGVFAVKRLLPELQMYPSISGNFMHNVRYRYQAATNSWIKMNAEDYYYPFDNMPLDIYAYYPYKANVNPNNIAYNASVSYDLMSARMPGVVKSTGSVPLVFKHKLSLMQVEIENPSQYSNLSVMMTFVLPAGVLALNKNNQDAEFTTTQPTAANPNPELNLPMQEELPGIFRLYLPPQSFLRGVPIFFISTGDDTFHIYASEDINYEGGKGYLFKPVLIHY